MAVRVSDVARAALADLGEEAGGHINAIRWTNERYESLAARRLKQLRKVGELTIPAPVTTGTVATRGSNAVVGDATAAAVWSSDLIGRFFRTSDSWYEIAAVNLTDLELTLKSEFAEDTVTAGTYQVVARYVTVPPQVGYFGLFLFARLNREITNFSLAELDISQADRRYITSGPEVWVDFAEDEHGRKLEFYPYSTTSEHVFFTYWERPVNKDQDAYLPNSITIAALKQGVLVDVMRYLASMAAKGGNVEMAAYWRNEYRSQETIWKRDIIPELVKLDQGIEDKYVILRAMRGHRSRKIENAYDEVWAR